MTGEPLKLPAALVPHLRCPGKPELALVRDGDELVAFGEGGPYRFPVINGTPVLIDEGNSVFRLSDFTQKSGVTTMDLRERAERLDTAGKKVREAINALIPPKSRSVTDFGSSAALEDVLKDKPDAKILVVGAGDARFASERDACIVYTDVALAPDTHMIADAHDIPFADGTFDAVLSIAVLEHVADPFRCAEEIRRVLVPGGRVYAITPFLQQVHMGRYDFTRFTAVGHRRLFRWFDEIRSGAANGPGMVVAWSIEYLFSTMAEGRVARSALRMFSRFLGWPFLMLDRWLARKRGVYDCASSYYFYGRLRETPIPDREIVETYRGLN